MLSSIGQRRRLCTKYRAGLHRQVVVGNVRRRQRQRLPQVGTRAVHVLVRQPVHEIQVEVGQPRGVQLLGAARRIGGRVDAAQHLQLLRAKTLGAQGHPVHAHGRVFGEAPALDGAGIGFQGDLDVALKTDECAGLLQHLADCRGRKQAGCAAPHENAGEPSARDLRQGRLFVQVTRQGLQIGGLRQCSIQRVGVEVAVRTFAHAPGEMHIQRQRRSVECHGSAASSARRACAR